MLVTIIPVRWFRVPNAGLTRKWFETWVYRPAWSAGLGYFFMVKFADVRPASSWPLGGYELLFYVYQLLIHY